MASGEQIERSRAGGDFGRIYLPYQRTERKEKKKTNNKNRYGLCNYWVDKRVRINISRRRTRIN